MTRATCVLGSLDLNDNVAFKLAAPPQFGVGELEAREVRGFWGARQVGGQVRGLVRAVLALQVLGADIDAIMANLAALRAALPAPGRLDAATLTYGRPGASTSRATTVVRSPDAALPDDELVRRALRGPLELVLLREPFWYGAETTLIDAVSTTLPGLVAIGTLLGDYPAPLEVTIDRQGSANLHCAHIGLLPTYSALAWADLFKEAEALTWSGGTTSAGPTTNQSASASKKNASTSYAIATFNETWAYDEGAYVPLIRCAILDTAQTATFKTMCRVGWAADYDEVDLDEQTITGAGMNQTRYLEFAPLYLPLAGARSGTPLSDLWVGMKTSSAVAGDEAVTDAVALVPAAWGYAAFHPVAYAFGCDKLTFKPDGTVYIDDVEHYAHVRTPGPIMAPPGAQRLAIVADVTGAASSLSALLTVKYRPRYAGV